MGDQLDGSPGHEFCSGKGDGLVGGRGKEQPIFLFIAL
jgi:hypothetical protein